MRTILHVDLDAYFAQVEQRRDPKLEGKPIAVVGKGMRTVIMSPSYEARKFGVKTAMRVPEALKLCPHLILVEGHNSLYADISSQLLEIYYQYTDMIEVYSIDEVFLDVSGSLKLFKSPETIGKGIKSKMKVKHKLSCSVGIAPNKLLAKLASDMHKPDGLFRIRPEDVPTALQDLPVGKLWGIGSKLSKYLGEMGIRTCGELGRFDVEALRKRFGVNGLRFSKMGRGEDDSPVVPIDLSPDPKSIGHSMTFEIDISDVEEMKEQIYYLAEKVGRRLRRGGFRARTVALTIRYKNFETFTRRKSVDEPINRDIDIYKIAERIFLSEKLKMAVRLFGVSVSNLSVRPPKQPELFDSDERRQRLARAIDKIKDKFGEKSIGPATLMGRSRKNYVISPAWRPKGPRNIEFK